MSEKKVSELQPKVELEGSVKQIELTGAFLDVGYEYDALLLKSRMGRSIGSAKEKLSVGEKISVFVIDVDEDRGFINVSAVKPAAVDWSDIVVGATFTGEVIRIKKFGVFVDIGAERPGLVHISELSHEFVQTPEDKVSRGDEIQVKVINFNRGKKQIDLSVKALEVPVKEEIFEDDEPTENLPTAMALAFEKAKMSTAVEEPKRKKKAVDSINDREDIYSRTLKEHSESD